jgi:hypothetical protein
MKSEEEGPMLIRVIYADGRYDMVKPDMLDALLEEKWLAGFKRRDGWVTVGRDPIRKSKSSQGHSGPERRSNLGGYKKETMRSAVLSL